MTVESASFLTLMMWKTPTGRRSTPIRPNAPKRRHGSPTDTIRRLLLTPFFRFPRFLFRFLYFLSRFSHFLADLTACFLCPRKTEKIRRNSRSLVRELEPRRARSGRPNAPRDSRRRRRRDRRGRPPRARHPADSSGSGRPAPPGAPAWPRATSARRESGAEWLSRRAAPRPEVSAACPSSGPLPSTSGRSGQSGACGWRGCRRFWSGFGRRKSRSALRLCRLG